MVIKKFANMINLIEVKIKERFNEEMAPKIFEKNKRDVFK